jgi:hypothetical protein
VLPSQRSQLLSVAENCRQEGRLKGFRHKWVGIRQGAEQSQQSIYIYIYIYIYIDESEKEEGKKEMNKGMKRIKGRKRRNKLLSTRD